MRNLVLALIVLGASSCCSTYTLTTFNFIGVIENFRPISKSSPDGDMMYTILINKEEREYAQYISFERFQIGDTVLVTAKMIKK
jgi:hypothetical protein